jgi:hypothetical protein
MLRVESYLLFYPYDMSQMYPFEKDPPGDSLWELGLDFTVSPNKTDFRGADQHYRLKGKERFRIFGLLVDGDVPADMGDGVFASGKQVGVVTCAMYSTLTKNRWPLPAWSCRSRSRARAWKSVGSVSTQRRRRILCRSTIRIKRSALPWADGGL